jgi:voltage-dependent potassium channel beta subunit
VTFGNQAGEETAYQCLTKAYDAGVNFFDTAEEYADGAAETVLGRLLKRTGWKRSDLVISTKIFWGGAGPNDRGLSRKHLIEGTNASLARLQLDYVDLLYCHRPDLHTPVEETVRAMNHIIDQGKAFYWGTSEWSAAQIMEACAVARREHLIPPTMEQPQYHMFHRKRIEKEYAHLYKEIGLGTTIYSPLASGLLSGKYNGGMPEGTRATMKGFEWLRSNFVGKDAERRIEKVRQLTSLAGDLGITMAQLALAWCLKNPNVSSVITGASKPEYVDQNMKALEAKDKLSGDVMDNIEKILANKPRPDEDYR